MLKSNNLLLGKLIIVFLLLFIIIGTLFSQSNYTNRRYWYEAGKLEGDNTGWMRYYNYRTTVLSPSGKLIAAGNPFTYTTFKTLLVEQKRSPGPSVDSPQSVLLIFNKGVYDYLSDRDYVFGPSEKLLKKYVDMINAQYGVIICTYDSPFMDRDNDAVNVNDCPPNHLRTRIQEYYAELKEDKTVGALAGCIFIGELPVKWYVNKNESTGAAGKVDFEFPIDMYFMDMDGTWLDSDSDGMLDGFNDNPSVDPEIWVGRITASRLVTAMQLQFSTDNPEGIILEDYFNKNVNFRVNNTGGNKKAVFLKGSNSALDTSTPESNWLGKMETFFGTDKSGNSNVTNLDSDNIMNETNFLKGIVPGDNEVKFIHIDITSSSFNHSFYIPTPANIGNNFLTSTELHQKNLTAPFYYIAGAAPARYIEDNYIGGAYIFTSNHRRIPQTLTDSEFNNILSKLPAGSDDYDFINGTAYDAAMDDSHELLVGAIATNIRDSNRVARILIKQELMNYAGGLTLVGSTKSFSMKSPADLYEGLRVPFSFGHSFKKAMEKGIYYPDDVESLFGMTIIGDPTLYFENETQQKINLGVKWVTEVSNMKNGKGGTMVPQASTNGAISAMTALTLLNRGINGQVVDDALTYLTTPWNSSDPTAGCLKEVGDEAWLVRPGGDDGGHTVYCTSLAVLAIAATRPDVDSVDLVVVRRLDILRKMKNFLVNCQNKTVNSAYEGGFRYIKYGYSDFPADNSNTQFALMGIYVASMALLPNGQKTWANLPADITTVFNRAKIWLKNSKMSGTNTGHQYLPGTTAYNNIMTAATAWSTIIVTNEYDKALEDFTYLANLGEPCKVDSSYFQYDPLYYAWTLAKACAMSRTTDKPLPGIENWYEDLAESLLSKQTNDGNWPDMGRIDGEHGVSLSTLFALLALETNILNDKDDIAKAFILSGLEPVKQIKARGSLYRDVTYLSRDPGDLPEVPADLRLYDVKSGSFTGIDTKTGKIYEQVPGSRFNLLNEYGIPVRYKGGPIPDGYSQEIVIWMPDPGAYRLELVGTRGTVEDPGKYKLDVVSIKNDVVESTVRFDNQEIIADEVQAVLDTVAVIDGGITNEPTPPKRSAVMALEPAEDTYILPYGQTSLQDVIRVKEIGGGAKINSLRVSYKSELKDADGTDNILPSMINVTIPPDTNIDENSYYDVIFTISDIPDGFDGPSTGTIRVEANEGLFKDFNYTIVRNRAPEANAGPDQTAYAGQTATPYVVVTLDGSGSADPDEDELTYKWYENGALIGEGVAPQVMLGVGVHTFTLEVSDGMESANASVTVTVVEAMAADVKITPKVINVKSWGYWVNSMMVLPSSVAREDLDKNFKVMLYTPSGESVTAYKQVFYGGHSIKYNFHGFRSSSRCYTNNNSSPVMIYSVFSRKDLVKKVSNGVVKLTAVYKLKSGQYVNAPSVVVVIGSNQKISSMSVYPGVIRRSATDTDKVFRTSLKLPSNIDANDIDFSVKAVLYTPDGDIIEAAEQSLFPDYGSKHFSYHSHYYPKWINAIFSQTALMEKLPENGYYELYQECKLKNGESVFGYCRVRITGKNW